MTNRFHSFSLATLLLLAGFLEPIAARAQTSGAVDCESIYLHVPSSELPLTHQEKMERMEEVYFSEVSRISRCEEPAIATSGEDASDGNASARNASAGNASGKGRSNVSSISVNNLRANEISTPIANAAVQTPTSIPNQTELEMLGTYQGREHESLETLGTYQGRKHESLETANNDAIIRNQIKEAADAETDPKVKANLMEEYEALK